MQFRQHPASLSSSEAAILDFDARGQFAKTTVAAGYHL